MKKLFIITCLLSSIGIQDAIAQEQDLTQALKQLDQAEELGDYELLAATFEQIALEQPTDWLPPYYAAYCHAKIGFMLQDAGEAIEPYSNSGEEQIKQSISLIDTSNNKKAFSEALTVLSMVYRTKVFINPMTYGRTYGIKSQNCLQKALELDADNPRAIYLAAWVKYYTPKTWGGDKEKAKELASKSLALLGGATNTASNPHWGTKENKELLSKY